MSQVNKFHWTEEERQLAGSKAFILTKHSIVRKVSDLFGELERELKAIIADYELEATGANVSAGKIFRGENYRLFPYVLLDYPRIFNTSTIFAFRSMFWWGNEFSFTLHLQGEALERLRVKLEENIDRLSGQSVYFCIADGPWQYHFEQDNYRRLDEMDLKEVKEWIRTKPFVKFSRSLPLDQMDDVLLTGKNTMKLFLEMLT